eukprot:688304_1
MQRNLIMISAPTLSQAVAHGNHISSSKMAELEKSVHDKIADRSWIDAQRNTFTKWANDILSPRTSHISDLSGDLFDGIVLIDLLEELSGRSVPHARRVRAMSVNMRRNRASQFSICGDTLRFI